MEEESSAKRRKIETDKENVDTMVSNKSPIVGSGCRCDICLENSSGDRKVGGHSCTTCKSDAWNVCESCEESFFSKLCPFCKNEYAPLVFYPVMGEDLRNSIAGMGSLGEIGDENMLKLLKDKFYVTMLKELVSRSHVICVEDPAQPVTIEENGDDTGEAEGEKEETGPMIEAIFSLNISTEKVQMVKMRMKAADFKLVENNFHFTNTMWDAIESEVEAGRAESTECDIKTATINVFTKTCGPGATHKQLYIVTNTQENDEA